ncbi:S1 family peptidase [Pontiella sulfatireligans]|uniref:Serine protease HtrA n=1 Tax=Pontiella sulfatireligans TaxID=2750658 RepID=A0A6C2UHK4_9BACT|nr:serine protease [Pontiella sulfatireligans]VGO19692.1 Putative serine protease HtrA [Pontiella sulfatireligans]
MNKMPNRLLLSLMLMLALPCMLAAEKENYDKKKAAKEEREKKEALEKRLAEEQEIKARFGYSVNDITAHLVIVSCSGAQGRSSGSGFVALLDGKPYLFTNQHVILGADTISFKATAGGALKPRGVELSTTRDIARLPLSEAEGLAISKNMAIGAPIAVFGNSEGGGVATELYGKVTSVSAELVEVSADFVSGNSGSPVLNLDKEVIGIASYVSSSSDDEDGSDTRRFCYRLTGNQWTSVDWKKYNDKFGKLYRDNEALVEATFEVANQWYQDPFNRVSADNHPDSELRKWSTSHNHMVNRIMRMREQGTATPHELENVNKQISKDLVDSSEDLAKVCRDRSKRLRMLAKQRGLTGFLRDEFNRLSGRLESAARNLDAYGEKLAKFKFFHFAE